MDARTDPGQVKSLTHNEARLIVIGMLLPVFMGSLDNTILASALPTIGRDFGDVHSLPWLITIYLLASTAVVPLYGKVSDIHGRRFALRIAIAMYMLGSLTCALAPNMLVLILGRALHVLGGFLSDYLHWSAIFWLNIPLGLTAAAVTTILLRGLPRHERPHRLDVIGAVLIVTASVAFMLGLNLGGRSYDWLSPPILALFAIALVIGAGFLWRLATAPEPLIPIDVLRNRSVLCSVIAHSFGWGSIIGLNIFLPMYLQNVVGLTPTDAGLSLMVLMIALNVSAGLSGYMLGRMIRYKLIPIAGLLIAIASTATLAWWVDRVSLIWFEILLIVIGLGFGPLPGLTQVSVQNSVGRHQLGISVGTMNFVRNLLATMLVATFGAIVAGAALVGPGGGALGGALDPAAAEAFRRVFFSVAGTLTVALIAVLLLEEKPLQTGIAPE